MKFKFLIAAALIVSAFASCKKDDDTDKKAPVLTITSPTESQSIAGTVVITGTLTDKSLHELLINVTDDATGDTLFVPSTDPEVHDLTSYVISEAWTPNGIAAETSVTLNVYAEDHAGNVTTKNVKFKVKP